MVDKSMMMLKKNLMSIREVMSNTYELPPLDMIG